MSFLARVFPSSQRKPLPFSNPGPKRLYDYKKYNYSINYNFVYLHKKNSRPVRGGGRGGEYFEIYINSTLLNYLNQ
jgi:hypothetical protein